METQVCTMCGVEKAIDEFYTKVAICKKCHAKKGKEYRETHKERIKEYQRNWRKENIEQCRKNATQWRKNNTDKCKGYQTKYREKNKSNCKYAWLLYEYGITKEEYNNMVVLQDGKCAICGKEPKNRTLCVDHDHINNKNRGLLCKTCNQGIGLLQESLSTIYSAYLYLQK